MNERANLPAWTEELRRRYLRGEALEFVLHGNVHDLVLFDGQFIHVTELLSRVLLSPVKDAVIEYNLATGVRFAKKSVDVPDLDTLLVDRSVSRVLSTLERVLHTVDRVGLIVDYAEMIAPAGDANFLSESDRQSIITLHRWSMSPSLERADSVILLVTENLSELNRKLVDNPMTATLAVPMPDLAERKKVIEAIAPELRPDFAERLAEVTAGLKTVQIRAILAPETSDELGALVSPAGDADETRRQRIVDLVFARKREIIERECFGLIEIVNPEHDFSVVGGLDGVKTELRLIAKDMREGRTNRCPMGLLFVGPMGTGKTFVAEAFVKETGLTAIKLKSFRSKWVGATEGNLEKILSVVGALGQVVVIVDEGDRAFGNQDDSDGGTSSRVIARLKEFMSDTDNRGRVLFILMTNRPDKLDIDIKRAGRLDRKIPFFYPQTAAEVRAVVEAQLRKHRIEADAALSGQIESVCQKLVGHSNADLEAIVLLANGYTPEAPLNGSDFTEAIRDYLPSRDMEMLEYMELVAVFEASNRRLLPPKYADLGVEELQHRVTALRARVGPRR
jgi:ATPase family associated with various cellular activities (AAA)